MAHPESLLLSAIVRTGEYQPLASASIASDLFNVHREEMEWVERYILRHHKAPSKGAFKAKFPAFVVYKVDDVAYLCDEVREEHIRQSLIDLMDQAVGGLDREDISITMSKLNAGLTGISTRTGGVAKDFDLIEDWQQVYDDVDARVGRVRKSGFAGIPSSFDTLDLVTGGWQPGWLGVLAARLGQGKTWTGVKMAYSAAVHGYRVTYFSLEQSRRQIGMRVHSFASRQYGLEVFNSLDLMRGKNFDLRSYKRFLSELTDQIGTDKFYINDSSRGVVTPMTVAATIEQKQPNIVIIDYLTLMGTQGDDWRATARLSGELQGVAQRYETPIIAISQVNRMGMGKEPPGAEHLSQSDALGHDADVVVTQMLRSEHVMKMRLAKFRHGPQGVTWNCRFSPSTGEYEEVSGDEAARIQEQDAEVD